jgi:ATP-dependent helicase/nuclease subunit B
VADREQFAQLSDFVNEKMKAIGKRILEGETEASPYQRKGQTACDYCDYREICGFDTKIPGTSYRRLREYDTEKIWKKIEGEE